jgi:hypothetical protein
VQITIYKNLFKIFSTVVFGADIDLSEFIRTWLLQVWWDYVKVFLEMKC